MYLKSLEVSGFKSFAQKTVLTFLPNKEGQYSITAIVGPNGSGKSNIADAIRWVMGEQSMKQLRGKKSEDIIFSGSEAKGQLSVASVELTLDNHDGKLPIEYEELVIGRRVYRSGESEYLVNGNPVRLLDLQILLAKSQFAHGSYSVVGQGMIDRMLLQTPEERKDFFDEATGIKEFQIKRHQAFLKLARTKEHMAQAALLFQEISPRLRTLSRQVKKLEERQEVETELRDAQESYYATLWTHHESQIADISAAQNRMDTLYRAAEKELSAIQEELAGLARKPGLESAFAELQSKYQEAVRRKNALEGERAVLSGRLQVEYSKAGDRERGWLNKKMEELAAESARAEEDLRRAERLIEDCGQEIVLKKKDIEALSVKRTELRGSIAEREREMMQLQSGEAVLQMTGMRAAEAILGARHEFGAVYGIVAQLARVEDRYQLAMDVAAGSHLSSLVVGDDRVAAACIEFLRHGQLGVATFLPLNKIKPRILPGDLRDLLDRPGVLGLAVELASFDKKFADVFSYIFGSTIIVDTIDTARQIGIGRIRMVTLAGDVLETSGSMRGGWRRRGREHIGFGSAALRTGESVDEVAKKIAALQNELADAERAYERAHEEMRERQGAAQLAAGKAEALGAKKQEIDREIASLSQERDLLSMDPKQYETALKNLQNTKEGLEDDIREATRAVEEREKEMSRFHEEEEKKKQRIFALQDAMQAAQARLNALVSDKSREDIARAKLETKQEDLANEIFQELRASAESIVSRGRTPLAPDALADAQQAIQKLKYRLSLIGGIDEEVVKEYEETKARHDTLSDQMTDLERAMGDLEEMIAELDELMRKKRDVAFKKIRKEFGRYFSLLFEGGKADLVEVYGEQPDGEMQNSEFRIQNDEARGDDEQRVAPKKTKKEMLVGIDVTANPPGKKIKNIQALSGGERTMTSIALVCAILHTNPSPFVVLDEVEAALDEANTLRFTTILRELAEQSQFILITHNRATMHAADALYGVTMGAEGVSQLVSVTLGS